MKIGVDIDNTLVQLQEGFFEFYFKRHKTNIPRCEGKYYLRDFLPISKDDENKMWDEYHDSDEFENVQLMPDAVNIINTLKKKHELIFVTDRPVGWKTKTMRFIKKAFPKDNFKVIFSKELHNEGGSKDRVCRDFDISYLIEDHPTKTVRYAENGTKVILFSRPWNLGITHKNIVRVNNWSEIPGVINGEL
jgi:uncharacterized HAD superfamily protein